MNRFFIVLIVCSMIGAGAVGAAGEPQKQSRPEKELLIGLIPEQNIFKQVERYTPLAEYLSEKTGLKIRLKVLTRYGNIVDNFASLGLDGAFFGSFTYALAHRKIGVEVLARPEALDGSSTYHGLIFVRKDSGIKGIEEMKDKRFAFVDKATTAGFLLPLCYFHENGITDYRHYFKETYFTGTHEDAIYDVLNKKADVGAAKNTVFERLARTDSRIIRDLKILAKSPDVPENAFAARKGLAPSVKTAIRETLLNMQSDPGGQAVLRSFGARRFIPTTDKDYDPVFRYAKEIHLDLSQYDYLNE
jgi:phosphonate transport system substrate-binding protein